MNQPTPWKPFDPVIGVIIFDGMKVNPATSVKVEEAPALPDIKILSVRSSPEKESEPLRMK
jgi:hypothetical protein